MLELARRLRERVAPELGSHAGRADAGLAPGGDVTFAVDAAAERELAAFIAERAPELAFYSEDRGLVAPAGGAAEHVLIVDPIDGTRPAMAGLESSCVSVALAPMEGRAGGEPTMADVELGCVIEIKSGAWFLAQRGAGVRSSVPIRLSENVELERLFWAYGLRGRPARPMAQVLGDLIDGCFAGGSFDLGSAAYDMTRVITGQLDAYVEPGPLLIEEVPQLARQFRRAGRGEIVNNSPYDLAAAALCLSEAGAVVTDARGAPLDRRPLLGTGVEHQMSVIASASATLHTRLVEAVAAGLARLRATAAGWG